MRFNIFKIVYISYFYEKTDVFFAEKEGKRKKKVKEEEVKWDGREGKWSGRGAGKT